MRKLQSYLLLILLLNFIFGGLITFTLQRQMHRERIERAIQNNFFPDAVQTFIFSTKEFKELNWEKENEFEYKGKMYDVIGIKKSRGFVFLKVLDDSLETSLIEIYNQDCKDRNESEFCFNLSTYIFQENNFDDYLQLSLTSTSSYLITEFSKKTFAFLSNDSPPPKKG